VANTPTAVYALNKPAQGDTPWTTTMNNDWDSVDAELAKPRIIFTSPTVGATTTCDLSLGRVFVFTVSQATTLAFTNIPSASFACRIRLLITNGSAFLITWPAAVSWLAGIIPTFKASGVDEVELVTKDAGTTWYATLRNLRPGVIFQKVSLPTSSTSDVSLTSYVLPANSLSVNAQALRVTIACQAVTQQGTVHVQFGATNLVNNALTAGRQEFITILLARTGVATQISTAFGEDSAAGQLFVRATPAETLSGAVTLDFRGSVIAGGTFTYDSIQVEYLST